MSLCTQLFLWYNFSIFCITVCNFTITKAAERDSDFSYQVLLCLFTVLDIQLLLQQRSKE